MSEDFRDDEPRAFAMAMFLVIMIALMFAFVLFMPAPDYMPQHGGDPRDIPFQMKD